MPSISLGAGDRRRTIFTLPETENTSGNSVLALSMPKAGSVLLEQVLRDLCPYVGLSYVSIMATFFNHGVADEDIPAETSEIFVPKGYCYGGFRNWPQSFSIPIVAGSRKILLIRDPRDMLVSHYYSMLLSHPAASNLDEENPDTEEGLNSVARWRRLAEANEINSYVVKAAPVFAQFMQDYRLLCEEHEVRIFRYEDIVFEKRKWIDDLCDWFEWKVPESALDEIAIRHDIVPNTENPDQHVRQVSPGDHTRKLDGPAIGELNNIFSNDMNFFGYPQPA